MRTYKEGIEFPERKNIRLKQHDYNSAGAYFITICTKNRREILSRIPERSDIAVPVGDAALGIPLPNDYNFVTPLLTDIGKIVEKYILSSNRMKDITVDRYVIMPDHIHVIVIVRSQRNYDSESVGSGTPRAVSPTEIVQTTITEGRTKRNKDVIPQFVAALKRLCNAEIGEDIFQRSYYDHIIRDRDDYDTRIGYIYGNPLLWQYNRHTHDKLISEVLL